MKVDSLSDLYKKLGVDKATVYVAPSIPAEDTGSSYLVNLYKPLKGGDSEYSVRSVSFWAHLLPAFHALFSRKVIFHYHWLEFQDTKALAGFPFKWFSLFLFRLCGGTLVWTVHNEQPHTGRFLKQHRALHQRMLKWSQGIHVHCDYAKERLLEIAKTDIASKTFVLPHPDYAVRLIDKEKALQNLRSGLNLQLDPDAPVWLIFGQISPYKQIPELIRAIKQMKLQVQIVVAGAIKKDGYQVYSELVSIMEKEPDYKIVPKWIEDNLIPPLFCAADLCLFNHSEIWASGSMQLALNYGKAIVAPAAGCITEMKDHSGVLLFADTRERDQILCRMAGVPI